MFKWIEAGHQWVKIKLYSTEFKIFWLIIKLLMRCSMVGKSKYIDKADNCHRATNCIWSLSQTVCRVSSFSACQLSIKIQVEMCAQVLWRLNFQLGIQLNWNFHLTSAIFIVTCVNKSMSMLLFRVRDVQVKWNGFVMYGVLIKRCLNLSHPKRRSISHCICHSSYFYAITLKSTFKLFCVRL